MGQCVSFDKVSWILDWFKALSTKIHPDTNLKDQGYNNFSTFSNTLDSILCPSPEYTSSYRRNANQR